MAWMVASALLAVAYADNTVTAPTPNAALPTGTANLQMLDAVERLRSSYSIPTTDVNLQSLVRFLHDEIIILYYGFVVC